MLTFIDWFAGIGGFRRGMELAGHKCVGFCEYDKFAVKSYRAMHDTEGEWFANDVRAVRFNNIPKSDVWCFGFPCQDISVAGKQKGMREGTRSGLFYTITSLLRQIEIENRPGTLFIENVKNLLSINGGWDFAKVIIELDEVGYDCEWQLLNSKNFGVPQNRERVFIIGHLRGRSRREIFPIGEPNETIDIKVVGTTNPDRHSSADIHSSDGIMSTICGRDYKQPKQIAIPVLTPDRPEKRQNGRRFKEDGEEMFCLTAQDRHGVLIDELSIQRVDVPQMVRVRKFDVDCKGLVTLLRTSRESSKITNKQISEHTNRPVTLVEHWFRKDKSFAIPDAEIWEKLKEILNIQTNEFDEVIMTFEDRFGTYEKSERCYLSSGIAPTLTSTSADEKIIHNMRIRKLTPLECFRLQGWSDDYFYKAASVNSDSQLYKQAGNGVTVNVIYEIAKRLED